MIIGPSARFFMFGHINRYMLLNTNEVVKKANKLTAYTPEQEEELKKCSDPITGPLYFALTFFKVPVPGKGPSNLEPYAFQEKLLHTYATNRFSISMVSRQTGKSTLAAAYLLWTAMFVDESFILIASNKGAGASEIMHRIRYAYENCPDHIRAGINEYNKGTLIFDNNSRIMATTTTETTGRGYSVTCLYADELAFVRPNIAKEFWASIFPTLANTNGKIIITSTPNSDEDLFATIWAGANKTIDEFGNETPLGVNGFKAFKADWRDHPKRTEEWAKAELQAIGEEKFRREHDLEFLVGDGSLIDPIKLAQLKGVDPMSKQGQIRWYKKPEPNKTYVVGWDPSLGTGRDPAAIEVFELPEMTQIAEWQHNKTDIKGQMKVLRDLLATLEEMSPSSDLYWSVENNTIGEAALVVIKEIGEENIPGTFVHEPKKRGAGFRKGFHTGNKSKLTACTKLKSLVETDRIVIKSKNLVSELKTFIESAGSYKAKSGETDDLVMATLLVVRIVGAMSNWNDELDHLKEDIAAEIEPMPIFVL